MNLRSLFTLLLLFVGLSMFAQSPLGVWKTIDDETGEAKSHVEIYEKDGKIFGKIVKLLQKPDDTTCDCVGDRSGKLLIGMDIIENMTPYKYFWANGTIFSPTKDKEYNCSFWFEDGKPNELQVRGKVLVFFRTQTWYKVE